MSPEERDWELHSDPPEPEPEVEVPAYLDDADEGIAIAEGLIPLYVSATGLVAMDDDGQVVRL